MSVITNIQCSSLNIDFAKNKIYFTNLLQCLKFILQRAVFYYDLPKHKNYNTYTHNRHLNPIEKNWDIIFQQYEMKLNYYVKINDKFFLLNNTTFWSIPCMHLFLLSNVNIMTHCHVLY